MNGYAERLQAIRSDQSIPIQERRFYTWYERGRNSYTVGRLPRWSLPRAKAPGLTTPAWSQRELDVYCILGWHGRKIIYPYRPKLVFELYGLTFFSHRHLVMVRGTTKFVADWFRVSEASTGVAVSQPFQSIDRAYRAALTSLGAHGPRVVVSTVRRWRHRIISDRGDTRALGAFLRIGNRERAEAPA